jgi:hypothetical protein
VNGHHPPHDCPVCGHQLALLRLGCPSCGTELSGTFRQCEFCALDEEERRILRSFLSSRGNMKHLERELGVSYPTARARFDALLDRLGLGRHEPEPSREEILQALADGELDVDTAMSRLGEV